LGEGLQYRSCDLANPGFILKIADDIQSPRIRVLGSPSGALGRGKKGATRRDDGVRLQTGAKATRSEKTVSDPTHATYAEESAKSGQEP
jgi:hypothetical protein